MPSLGKILLAASLVVALPAIPDASADDLANNLMVRVVTATSGDFLGAGQLIACQLDSEDEESLECLRQRYTFKAERDLCAARCMLCDYPATKSSGRGLSPCERRCWETYREQLSSLPLCGD